jgi:hypothetical protein
MGSVGLRFNRDARPVSGALASDFLFQRGAIVERDLVEALALAVQIWR